MTFLPKGYERPATGSNYFKPVKGENRIRILGEAIVGWELWDKTDPTKPKVIRSRKPLPTTDQENKTKHFWAFPVYDYASKAIKIYCPTQSTIHVGIETLSLSPDWGDVKEFDIIIKRTGDGMETEYSIVPVPPKPMSPEIIEAYGKTKINLNALFDGKDPFNEKTTGDNSEISVDEIPF